MKTILLIGNVAYRILDSVEQDLLTWADAPGRAVRVEPEMQEALNPLIDKMINTMFPQPTAPKETVSPSKEAPKDTVAPQGTSKPKFSMAEDGKQSASPESKKEGR